VLISTDKAVNPTNVMGATKRAAEMVVVGAGGRAPGHALHGGALRQRAGQQRQRDPEVQGADRRGGPVTVTHPDIIRYFMTIPEAARLVLQAAAIGDSGQVLVLDMGEPVKIVDLARDL
jgi:FlaA1/EpsC-like NDP-sugar epimerase